MLNSISPRRIRLGAAAALMAAALPLGCLSIADAHAQAPKTIRAVMQSELKDYDPIISSAGVTNMLGLMVFDTLFSLDAELRPQPQMVGRYDVSQDGLTYSFTLRDGLKFHDGTAVKAEDVVASLKRWWVKDGGGQIIQATTKELSAVDDMTFRVILKEPYGLLLDTFAKHQPNVPVIMPKRLAETDPNQQVAEALGSGPFRFAKDEWVPGTKAVFVKNAAYVPRAEPPNSVAGGKVVKVDRVEWVVLPDPQTSVQALNRGEIDFLEQPPVELLRILRANKDVKIENPVLGQQGIMRLNHLQRPFTDVRARHAMQWLVNQRDFMAAGVGDPTLWQVCGSILICDQPMAFQDGADMLNNDVPNEQRIAKAKELLKAAGYNGEPVVVLDSITFPAYHSAATVFVEALKKAGVNVQQETMDWTTLTARRTKNVPVSEGGWSLFFTSNGGLNGSNPAFNITTKAGCEKAWVGWPCSQQAEDARNAWSRATTMEDRKKFAREFQIAATENVIYVPYGVWKAPFAYRTTLKNLLNVSDLFVFWNVEKN